jgi:hypothetical protein
MDFKTYLESEIKKIKGPHFKFFGYTYEVDGKEFGTEEEAKEYLKDKETGRGPDKPLLWYGMSPEERESWARRNVEGWSSLSMPQRRSWHGEHMGNAITAQRAESERLAAEKKRQEAEENANRGKTRKEAHKAAAKYKPKRKYFTGQFKVRMGDETEYVEGIGDSGLYIRKAEGGWVVCHAPTGFRVSSPYPNKGAALKAMDNLNDLDADWTADSYEKIGLDVRDVRRALEL